MTDNLCVVDQGCRVVLHLRLKLVAGHEVESTYGEEPLEMVVGDGTLAPGLERALSGMCAGEHREVILDPDSAFGARDAHRVYQFSRDAFPASVEVEPELIWSFTGPDGEELSGLIVAVEDDTVTVDFNHPLAGHEIVMEADIISVAAEQGAGRSCSK